MFCKRKKSIILLVLSFEERAFSTIENQPEEDPDHTQEPKTNHQKGCI